MKAKSEEGLLKPYGFEKVAPGIFTREEFDGDVQIEIWMIGRLYACRVEDNVRGDIQIHRKVYSELADCIKDLEDKYYIFKEEEE